MRVAVLPQPLPELQHFDPPLESPTDRVSSSLFPYPHSPEYVEGVSSEVCVPLPMQDAGYRPLQCLSVGLLTVSNPNMVGGRIKIL